MARHTRVWDYGPEVLNQRGNWGVLGEAGEEDGIGMRACDRAHERRDRVLHRPRTALRTGPWAGTCDAQPQPPGGLTEAVCNSYPVGVEAVVGDSIPDSAVDGRDAGHLGVVRRTAELFDGDRLS